jgi:hypothetical protein
MPGFEPERLIRTIDFPLIEMRKELEWSHLGVGRVYQDLNLEWVFNIWVEMMSRQLDVWICSSGGQEKGNLEIGPNIES